ncbi:MAG: phage tail protein [Hyphomicrobiaceae bacterium]
MPQFVCAERKAGPNCSDKRLETTDPEKKDCIKRALFQCTADVWDCRANILTDMPTYVGFRHPLSGSGSGEGLIEPLDDLQCYTDSCLEQLLECFCTGLSALVCTMCDDSNGFNPFPDDDEGDVRYEDGGVLDYVPITFSDTNAVIPIAFGTVLLGGNIIWIDEPDYDAEDRPTVDFAVGVCEGVLSQVLRVWVGDQLVVDRTSGGIYISPLASDYGFKVTMLAGSEAQRVYAPMVDAFGKTPGYRGLAVVHFENYPISDVNGRMPDVRMEVATVTDGGNVAWTDTTFDTDPGALKYSGASRRAVTSDGSSISIREDSASSAIWTDVSAVNTSAVDYSDSEDIGYQLTDNTAVFRYSECRDVVSSVALGYAADKLSVVRVPGEFFDHPVIATLDANVVRGYAADNNSPTMSLFTTNTNSELTAYTFISTMKVLDDSSVSPINMIAAIGQAADGKIHFDRYILQNPPSVEFVDDGTWETIAVAPSIWGLTATATLLNVVHLRHYSKVVLFLNNAGHHVAVIIDPSAPAATEWVAELVGSPTGELIPVEYGNKYVFLAGSRLYEIDLIDGSTEFVYDITTEGAPAYGGAQHYDTQIDVLTYVTDTDTLGKVRPGRYIGLAVTLEEVARAILVRAGLDETQFDLSSLSGITTDGFAITEQASAASAIESLSEFYHLGLVEASRGVRIAPLGSASSSTINTTDYSVSYVRRRFTERIDQVNFVRVVFFDKNKEYAPSYQDVYRDILLGEEQGDIGTGVTIDVKLFTDATTARLSAELEMMKRIQNAKEYTALIGPRYLAVEPLDFVTFSDGSSARVTKVTLDTTDASGLTAVKDEAAFYAESPAMSAIDFGTFSSQISSDVKLTNIPIVISSPPARDGHNGERVWVGQLNPETSQFDVGFSAHTVYWNNPAGGPERRTSTTKEAMVGSFVSGLDILSTAEFKTDRDNTLVIKFAKDIPAGTFSDATYDEILASYTKNLLIVGKEQIQFMTHSVDVDNRTVTFTNLVRGKFGTDWYIRKHQTGELCAYYTPESFTWTDLNNLVGDIGQVSLSFAAVNTPAIRRTVTRQYFSVKREWMAGQFQFQEHPQRVFFKYRPRVPFRNTLEYDQDQINGLVYGDVLKILVTTTPYDKATFEAAWESNDWGGYVELGYVNSSDFDDNTLTWVNDITIERTTLFTYGYVDSVFSQSNYQLRLIKDLHVVVVKGSEYKRAVGFTIPKGTQYGDYSTATPKLHYGRTLRVY